MASSSGDGSHALSPSQRPSSPPIPIRYVPPPLISDRSSSSDSTSSSSTLAAPPPSSNRYSLLAARSPPSSYGREHRLSLLSNSPGVFEGKDDQRAQFLQNLAFDKALADEWQLIDVPAPEAPLPKPPSRRSSSRRLSAIMSFGGDTKNAQKPGLKKSNSFFRRLKGGNHDEETAPPVPDVAPQIPRLSTFLLDKDQPLIPPNSSLNGSATPRAIGTPSPTPSGPRPPSKSGPQYSLPPGAGLPAGAGFGPAPVPGRAPMSPTSPTAPGGPRMAPWSGSPAPSDGGVASAPTPPPRHPLNQPNGSIPNGVPNGVHQPTPKRTSYGIPNGPSSANGHAGYANGSAPNGVPNGLHKPNSSINSFANGSAHSHSNGSANGHGQMNGAINPRPLPSRKGSAPVPYLNQPNGYGHQTMSPPTSPSDGKYVQHHIPYSQPHQIYSRPPLLDQTLAGRANSQASSAAATPSPPAVHMGQSHSAQQNAQQHRVLSKSPPAHHQGPMSPPTSPPQRVTSPEAVRPMSPPSQNFSLPPGAGPAKPPVGARSSRPNGVPTQHHVFQQAPSPPASFGSHRGHGHQRGPSAGFSAQAQPQRPPTAPNGAAAPLQRVTSPASSHGHNTSPPPSMAPQPNGYFAVRPPANGPPAPAPQSHMPNRTPSVSPQPPHIANGAAYPQQQKQQPVMATRPARSTSVSKNTAPVQASGPAPPLPDGAENRRWSSRPGAAQPNGAPVGMTTSSGARVEIVGNQHSQALPPSSGASVSVVASSRPQSASSRPQSARQPSGDNYGSRGVASPPPVPAPVPVVAAAPAAAPAPAPAPALAPVAPVHTQHPRPPEKPERSADRSLPHLPQLSTRPSDLAPANSGTPPIISPTPKSAALPRPTIVIPQTSSNTPPPKVTPYGPTPVNPVNAPAPSSTTSAVKPTPAPAPAAPPAVQKQQNGHPPNMGSSVSRAFESQHSNAGQGQAPSLPASRVQANGYPNGHANGTANGYANGKPNQVGNGLPSALKGVPPGIRTSHSAATRRIASSPLASPVTSTAPNNPIAASMPKPHSSRSVSQPSSSTLSSSTSSSQASTEVGKEVVDMIQGRPSVMSRSRPTKKNEKSLTFLLSHPRVVISLLPFLNINQFLNLLASDNDLRKYISGEMVGRWVMREWGVTIEKERGRSWPGLTVWEGFLESLLHDPAVYSTYPEQYHNLLRHLSLSHTLVVLFLRTMPPSSFPFSAPLPFDDDLTPPQLHKSSSVASFTSGMITPPRRPGGSRPGSRAGSVAGSEPGSPFGRMPRRERVVEVIMPEPLSATPQSASAIMKPWDAASMNTSMGSRLRRRRGSGSSVQSGAPVGTFGRKRANSVSSMNTMALQAPPSHNAVPLPQGKAGLPPVSYPTAKRYEFTSYSGHSSKHSIGGGFSSRPGSIMSAQTSNAHSTMPSTMRGSAWGSRSTTHISLAQQSLDLPVPPPIGGGSGSRSSMNGSDSHRSRNSERGSHSPIQRRWDSPTQGSKYEPAFDRPPPYMPGRAPILRVFVPVSERVPRWPSAEGAAASWRELEKCGASKRMRLGDLVVNTALNKPTNTEHVLIYIPFIEHKLVPLEYNHCTTGHLPHYLDAFALSPMYYDPFLPTPQIIYLDFSPFAKQAMDSVRLAHDRRDVTVASGARISAKRYLHVAGFEVVPTPDERIAKEWAGQISLEAEGTAEGRHEMEARFGFGDPRQCQMGAWEVVRERSMVGSLWLRLVREEPRISKA